MKQVVILLLLSLLTIGAACATGQTPMPASPPTSAPAATPEMTPTRMFAGADAASRCYDGCVEYSPWAGGGIRWGCPSLPLELPR